MHTACAGMPLCYTQVQAQPNLRTPQNRLRTLLSTSGAVILPRANNTASGDTLVVLNVRRRPPLPGDSPRSPDLPQIPGITFAIRPAKQQGSDLAAPKASGPGSDAVSRTASCEAAATAAAVAAAAATSDPRMQERVAAALGQLLGAAPPRAAAGGEGGGLDWSVLEAGVDDAWPPM